MGDTKQVLNEIKRIDDGMKSKEAEILKYERFLSKVNEELAKEKEVLVDTLARKAGFTSPDIRNIRNT